MPAARPYVLQACSRSAEDGATVLQRDRICVGLKQLLTGEIGVSLTKSADSCRTHVIGCNGQVVVAIEAIDEQTQIGRSDFDVVFRIE